jgi:hypothetical protein
MFILALAAFCLAMVGVYVLANFYGSHKHTDGIWTFSVFTALFLIGAIISTMVGYAHQISDFEELSRYKKIEVIYQDKCENLTNQFSALLAELYPSHERSVFENISPDGVDIYLVKYPELRASKTVLELVAQIRSLQDDVYQVRLAEATVSKRMRFRARNPWLVNCFIPNL